MANPAFNRDSKGSFLPALFGGRKQMMPFDAAVAGSQIGWSPFRFGALGANSAAASPRKLTNLLGTYGGSDDSVSWVYACVSLVQQELASYPYIILRPNKTVVASASIPADLRSLLDEPNEDMTYFDMTEFLAMDLELAGNSYWLKDERNVLGQPAALHRLRPEYVRIAVNDAGRIYGYLYHLPGIAIPVPYTRDEIIHFKRPNPLNEYYGMGTVEAIQRALDADLSQTDHIVGFYSNGARISGVLTVGTLSEVQFDRFKQQFYEEYVGDQNAHKILIAEEGTRFDPITTTPGDGGVVSLRAMTKDEILSAFGIAEFLLGGAAASGSYNMEQAQMIFGRRMMPKARRISEKFTRDLTMLWQLMFQVNVTYAEPRSIKIDRASSMLSAGATINEARREMDEPPVNEDWANLPLMPQGFAPFGMMHPGGAPAPPGSVANTGTLPGSAAQIGTATPPDAPTDQGGNNTTATPASTTHWYDPQTKQWYTTTSVYTSQSLAASTNATPISGALGPGNNPAPPLPEGFEIRESWTVREADPMLVAHLLDHQQRSLSFAHQHLIERFDSFFEGQEYRVLSQINGYADTRRQAESFSRERSKPFLRKDLTIGRVWNHERENDELVKMYQQALDAIGTQSMAVDAFDLVWDPSSRFAQAMKDRLAREIVGVNDTTREAIGDQITEGLRRNYTVKQIALGVPEEGYAGIRGIFYQARDTRIQTIARTEGATAHNIAILIGFKTSGHQRVEVIDGSGDDECRRASGSVWRIEEALHKPVGHPNAVFEATPIASLGSIEIGYSAVWSGPAVEVRTAAGRLFTVTPNHPVLTGRGWIAADKLCEGDEVIRRTDKITEFASAYLQNMPTRVEKILGALRKHGTTASVVPTADHLHGDGRFCQSEIDVVVPHRPLTGVGDISLRQEDRELILSGGSMEHPYFAREGATFLRGDAVPLAASGRVGLSNVSRVGTATAELDAHLSQAISDHAVADSELTGELESRFSCDVALDKIVEVRNLKSVSGRVYDLQTSARAYFADGILISNCIRTFAPTLV